MKRSNFLYRSFIIRKWIIGITPTLICRIKSRP